MRMSERLRTGAAADAAPFQERPAGSDPGGGTEGRLEHGGPAPVPSRALPLV